MNKKSSNWWSAENCRDESGMENHTPRVWRQIEKAAEAAGDFERADEARDAGERCAE